LFKAELEEAKVLLQLVCPLHLRMAVLVEKAVSILGMVADWCEDVD
jgi:hypothetical protein